MDQPEFPGDRRAGPTIYAAVEMRLMSGLKQERMMPADWNRHFEVYRQWEQLVSLRRRHCMPAKSPRMRKALPFAIRFQGIWLWFPVCRYRPLSGGPAVIRAALLDDIASAFEGDRDITDLLVGDKFRDDRLGEPVAWREVVKSCHRS